MNKISVLIVDDIDATREDIKRLLYFEEDIEVIGEASDGDEAIKMTRDINPDVILMDINMPKVNGIMASEIITEMNPNSSIIIISIQSEKEYLRKAMTAGARDYLVKPFSSEELAETIRRVGGLSKKRHLNLVEGNYSVSINNKSPGKIITFFSTKGGIGKTTIACNLAISLTQKNKSKMALVDMDLQGGDISVFMNLPASAGLDEIVKEDDYTDPSLLETYLTPHLSGVRVITAPSSPEKADLVNSDHVEGIITALKTNYDYVFLDISAALNDINIACLEISDLIILVADQNLPTLRHAKANINILKKLNLAENARLVINRKRNDSIKFAELEKHLDFKVWYSLPDEMNTVDSSINQGKPFTLNKPTAEISIAFNKMAAMLDENCNRLPIKQVLSENKEKSLLNKIFNF
ncbi:MAG: MinD/ParA family protein [Peptococcaceae bacterium]|nr:MinD/ParA family protein [Peptococcaceae bacterium]